MSGEEAVELAVVFEHASGRLLEAARRFVLSLPELAGPALIDCQLAQRSEGTLLVALARFNAEAFTPAVGRRLTFWAEQCGGASQVLRDLDLLERANFLAQFEAAETRSAVAVGGAGLAAFFPSASPPAPLELELDLTDPRHCRWDFETAGLFVVGDLAPPVGDVVALKVNAPGSVEPLIATGTVALVRTSGQMGFALNVAAPPTGLAVALAELKRVEAQLQEEGARAERRATVRHAIALPVEVSLGPDAALVGTTVNVSIDGAFIKVAGSAAMNTEVRLRFELPGDAELRARAKIVNVVPAGIGVRFLMDAEARGTLARTLTALVTPPPPPPDDELPVVNLKYTTAEALAPHLQTLMVGGASTVFDPGLELQQAVQVKLELPDGSTHLMTATVVLASETGVGLELHPDAAKALELREALAKWATVPPAPPDEVSELSLMDLVGDDAAEASVLSMVDLLASPAPPSRPAKPPPRLGDYELLSLLGRGGMAEVYYARAVEGARAGRFAAIKRLSPEMASNREALDLFTAEADILHLLRHPNIVETFEVGMFQAQPYLVMEAVDGRDLAQIIRRCRDRRIFLPTDFACFLIKSVLDALDCAHHAQGPSGVDLNLVHCDVSPHNVFISRVGEIKLGDFGLAQAATEPGKRSGKVRGKPSYLSPEALDGEISVLADLWAVNVTLYELLTLQTPFVGETPEDQLKAIRKQRMKSPEELRPDLPKPLLEIVKRGFEKKAKNRYASAAELGEALTPHFDPNVGTPLAIAAVVRGLFTT